MLIFHLILTGAAVAATALGGSRRGATTCVAALALLAVGLGAPLLPALTHAAPLVVFLTAALTLATAAERAGLADRAADELAGVARGSIPALYALVCAACALATAVLSLDGAVVLMVPLLLALARRHDAPLHLLVLGTVAVANAASIAVPQGNPTNLVLIERLGMSPAAFAERMALPGLAAALACAVGAAAFERSALSCAYIPRPQKRRLDAHQRRMASILVIAGLVSFVAPFAEIPAWWALPAVAGLAFALERAPRPRPVVPVRLAVQLTALLVLVGALGAPQAPTNATGPVALAALALLVGAASALVNNLPVSVSAGSLLAAGPTGYAATIGLGAGALATPQGSVATLLVSDLSGCRLGARRLAPLAVAGVVVATAVLAVTG